MVAPFRRCDPLIQVGAQNVHEDSSSAAFHSSLERTEEAVVVAAAAAAAKRYTHKGAYPRVARRVSTADHWDLAFQGMVADLRGNSIVDESDSLEVDAVERDRLHW